MFGIIFNVPQKQIFVKGVIMKTKSKILIAFIMNLLFSIFEFFGGIFTGSIAITSDAVHDLGDALSIGISLGFEKKSEKKPDDIYTYGYARYSLLGGLITIIILILSSIILIYNSILKFITPTPIRYGAMIIFAIIGFTINLFATLFTHGGHSINQKAISLHMLEDVFGWLVVLLGAIVMRFTDFYIIDPILSIVLALIILFSAIKNLKEILDIFLLKKPKHININEIKKHLLKLENLVDVHHIHIWTIDGQNNYATLHVVATSLTKELKHQIKEELKEHRIFHTTIELETEEEKCDEKECVAKTHSTHCLHNH